jgi:DNA polymerase bacteriophage-type
MEQKEAKIIIDVFRASYPEICGTGYSGQMKGIWVQLEEAVFDVMDGQDTRRRVGPGGSILIDKLNIQGRDPLLRIHLPSGRKLHYMDASVQPTAMPWENREGGTDYRPALHYYQEDEKGLWRDTHTHGGKIFENIVQGIARDVLAVKLLMFERADIPVVGHVHDEGISLVAKDPFSPGLPEMVDIMSEPVDWAPSLLLGADGFEGSFYHK